ncbi:guanylate kinase [Bdellovibrio bacteriovorus]|uniref:guanylate kinase n=1 Tax=Bdellovibrio TaxID=958 RepID=UPI0035A8DC37
MKTRLIIVAAPSGAGKSSFVEKISKEDPRLVDIITFTTRAMRKGESDGQPYHFIGSEEFQQKIKEEFFVEWAKVHTNFYGTSYESIESTWKQGKCAIMDIDIQGVATFKSKFPDAKTVFILPPSIDELRRRIAKRDGGMPADIEVRMANAEKEIREASKFDYQIVNDNFEQSYSQFKKIVEELLA